MSTVPARRSVLPRHGIAGVALVVAALAFGACGESSMTTSPSGAAGTRVPTPAGRAPACTTAGETWVSPADGATLVCVPSGAFLMGSTADDPTANAASQPRREVRLRGFWIDRTEVTNAAFARCVEADGCPARPTDPGSTGVASKTRSNYYYDPDFADYPVLIYTPDEAIAYCACMGRRLPTEAEWERAAGGSDGRRFPWGDTLDCEHASHFGCTTDTTPVEVPLAGASPVGALNMAGNVAEWVADLLGGWLRADVSGRRSDRPQHRRVPGPAWAEASRAWLATSGDVSRLSGAPAHYFDGQMGFRCATSAVEDDAVSR